MASKRGPARGRAASPVAAPAPSAPSRPQADEEALGSRDLALLLAASGELAATLDVAGVLSRISASLLEIVPAWRCGVLLLEGETHLRLAGGSLRREDATQLPRGRLLELARYPEVQAAVRTRAPVVVDVATDPLVDDVRASLQEAGLTTLFVLPLVVQDKCLGVLSLGQGPGAPRFTTRQRALVQAVAHQASIALRHAQLFGELQASARGLEIKVEERTRRLEESHLRLGALHAITAAMNASLDLDRILEAALQSLARVPGMELAQAYLAQEPGDEAVEAFQIDGEGRLQRQRVVLGTTGAVALQGLEGRPVPFDGIELPAPRSHVLVPLVSKDGVVGGLQVVSPSHSAYGNADLELLEQVAGELSLAIERTHLYRAAQKRSAQFELISDVSRRLTSAVADEDIHPVAASLVRRSFGYPLAVVLTLSADESELVVSGVSAEDAETEGRLAGLRLSAGAEPFARALQSGEPLATTRRGAGALSPAESRPQLLVPIRAGAQTLGLIVVHGQDLASFTGTDLAVMRTLADQLAASLQLSRLFEDLHRGHEFTERVMNNMTGGLIVTDHARVVQVINHRGADMLRADRWDLLGRDLLEAFPTAAPLFLFSPDAISRECEIELRDGSRIPVGFSNAFFADARHESDAVIIMFRDLSEIRALQRQVRHAERLATIGTVAAGVAHEIRNPLFGISATAQVLAADLAGDPQLQDLCAGMLDETRRLNALVEGLVTYGRPSTLHPAPVDPCRAWDEVIAQERARATERGIAVEHACASSGRAVQADADQLKQVLLNLLLNGLDAARSRVEVGADWPPDGRALTLWIEDDGPGVPPDQIDRIFDLFYTTKSKGSGMGLALSIKIVEDHGGTLRVLPGRQGGARFEVQIPVTASATGDPMGDERS